MLGGRGSAPETLAVDSAAEPGIAANCVRPAPYTDTAGCARILLRCLSTTARVLIASVDGESGGRWW